LPKTPRSGATYWRLLLLLPIVAVVWLPFYDHVGPTLWGWPFFYWYQMLWVLLTALITGFVFLMEDAGYEESGQ
jgi:hypothetical protein